MKKGQVIFLTLCMVLSLNAQQYVARDIGASVDDDDRKTWKKIKDPTEVHKKEIIAAYNAKRKDWLYAEIIMAPGPNFSGLACFVKDGLFYNFFAANFKDDVRKLLPEEELARHKTSENFLACSIN